MTRYILPADLGGGYATETETDPALTVDGRRGRIVRTDAGTVLAIADDLLTPQVPEQPPLGSVVLAGFTVFHHRPPGIWRSPGNNTDAFWADVVAVARRAGSRPILLTADLTTDPVTLPMTVNGISVDVSPLDPASPVRLYIRPDRVETVATMSVGTAQMVVRALRTAIATAIAQAPNG